MKIKALAPLVGLVAILAVPAGAANSTTPDADVETIATVIIGFTTTNFEFNLYNCPAGAEIAIVEWFAQQPDRPGNSAFGAQQYGLSNGDRVQHLTLTAASDLFVGERWVGSGTVACGTFLIPVEGSGQTVGQTGV